MKYKIYITFLRFGGLIYELPTKKIWKVRGRPSKDWIEIGEASSLEEALKKALDYISSQ